MLENVAQSQYSAVGVVVGCCVKIRKSQDVEGGSVRKSKSRQCRIVLWKRNELVVVMRGSAVRTQ